MNLLSTSRGRLAAFFLLYVTEGMPFGFAMIAVVTAMRRGGLGADDIGWFALFVALPWSWKFLFGPIVDLIGFGRFGHRRGWILLSHAVIVVGLLAASTLDPTTMLVSFTVAMVFVNGFCALQDVAIDALAVSSLRPEERGLGNGLMFAGAYFGQFLGGAMMLKLSAATGGLTWAFPLIALGVAAISLLVVYPMKEEAPPPPPIRAAEVANQVKDYVVTAGKAMFGAKNAIAAAVFAVLPHGAFALGMVISNTIGVELGIGDNELGNISAYGTIIGAAGCIIGGIVSDRLGHRRMLAIYILATLAPTIGLAWSMSGHAFDFPLADGGDPVRQPDALINAYWAAVLTYGFISGLAYGTRSAVYMQVCDPKVAGTQFTAYMAGMNMVIAYTPAWQGEIATRLGYSTMFGIDCAFGMLCLAVLPFISPRADASDETHPIPGAEPKPA